MKTVQTVYGVFDTDLGRLVGIAPQGVSDVTFLAGQDTQTVGYPVTALVNPVTGGSRFLMSGDVVSGEWVSTPPILKVLLNGTGTVSMDSRDANGVVSVGVASMSVSNASNLMTYDFFPGETAMAVRFNLTNSATAKVI